MTDAAPEAVLVRGPVGVGKTSIAATLNWILSHADVPHAVLELDWLSSSWPHVGAWNSGMRGRNVRAVAEEYRAIGIERFVLASVVEERSELDDLSLAVGVERIVVCRLRASLPVISDRLNRRDTGAALEWHLERAEVLSAQMETDGLDDFVVDTDARDHYAVAEEIADRLGWTEPGD